MGYNSEKVRAVAKMFESKSKLNRFEGTCQKSCKSSQNKESYG